MWDDLRYVSFLDLGLMHLVVYKSGDAWKFVSGHHRSNERHPSREAAKLAALSWAIGQMSLATDYAMRAVKEVNV